MPHFALMTTDGDLLGPVELSRTDWPAGSVIFTETGAPNLRVVELLEGNDPETFAILIVEPL